MIAFVKFDLIVWHVNNIATLYSTKFLQIQKHETFVQS